MKRSVPLEDIRLGLRLLTPSERRNAVLLAISIIINGLLQTFALAGVVPFIQALLNPQEALRSRWAEVVYELGIVLPADRLLPTVGLCLLVLVLAKNLYAGFQTRWQSRFSAECEQRLASELLRRFLAAPYAWNNRQNTSVIRDIILGHVVQWSRGFLRTSLQLANDLLFVVLAVGFLVVASPQSGSLIFCGTGAVAWLLMRFTRPILLDKARTKREASYRAGILCNEALSGVRDVKMTGSSQLFVESFRSEFSRYSFADSDAQLIGSIPRLLLETLGYGALIGTALIVIWRGGDYSATVAVLALYGIAAVRLLPVFNSALGNLNKLLDALPQIEDILRLSLDTRPAEQENEIAYGADPFRNWRKVTFANVGYRYGSSERPSLAGFTMELTRGESLGIVGPSGAGKSTLADLLSALLEPSEGTIKVDGISIHGLNRLGWRGHIGYVSQTPFVLDASLQENIVFGQPIVNATRLEAAIRAAHLDVVVAQMPDGLETRLGERGVKLSGGQRQRVAISRALYRDVDLLLLDEATSALDTLSEREVTEAIRQLVGTVTVVVIAHRLATVKHCDRIAVLDGGRLIDVGTHDVLVKTCPIYREMVDRSDISDASGGNSA